MYFDCIYFCAVPIINARGTERGKKRRNTMNNEQKGGIIPLSTLKQEGKKMAFVNGNRSIKEKNMVAKMESMARFGQVLPAVIVNAADIKAVSPEIVDAETGEAVPEAELENYVVLLDGQHRYKAYLQNEKAGKTEQGEFHLMYPLNPNIDPRRLLAVINGEVNPWGGADFLNGAQLLNPGIDFPLLNEMKKLTDLGFSVSTASLWLTFNNGIGKQILTEAMNGEIDDCLINPPSLENGLRLLEAARKMLSDKFLRHRYLPDFLIKKYQSVKDVEKADMINRLVEFLSGLTKGEAEALEGVKGKLGKVKEQIIIDLLNASYDRKYKVL